ncbi:DUF7344 domain-containing protein [Halorussus aquaticus]|uniref:DUF7344 domain-containing protein n=1 Tax=Halorussus aquaticus TaxID=2953748 RepID=A0ABD5PWS2_9EURY|nr:hypothetical protein [Halorussus aquaticus]
MSEDPSEATPETQTATTDHATTGGTRSESAPTANLLTGDEPSEKLDAAFDLLADPLRREALSHLRAVENEDRDGESDLELSSLADAIAAERTPDDGDTDARSLAFHLHHSHLPKLESHGVVTYDSERRTVRYRGHAWLDEWLDHVERVASE